MTLASAVVLYRQLSRMLRHVMCSCWVICRLSLWRKPRQPVWLRSIAVLAIVFGQKERHRGNYLKVVSIHADCDHDTLLIKAIPEGPVCHTGSETCFDLPDKASGVEFLGYLQDFITRRHDEMPEGSYTTKLFQKGINRMAQKVGEEAVETVIEATNGTDDRLVYEGADLLYHLIVLLTSKGFKIQDLVAELILRHKE